MYSSTNLPSWLFHAFSRLRKFISHKDVCASGTGYFTRPTNAAVAFIADTVSNLSREDIAELIFWLLVDPNESGDLLHAQEENEELQLEIKELKKQLSILQADMDIIHEYTERYKRYG